MTYGILFTLLMTVMYPPIRSAWFSSGTVIVQRLPEVAARPATVLGATVPAPAVAARAWGVWDPESQQFLAAERADERHPIASVSKLMTALVALEQGIAADTTLTLTRDDNDPEGSRVALSTGSIVSVRDLLGASLVGSANNATEALVRATGVAEASFVRLMNDRAAALGMTDTRFSDVTGLGNKNGSTVRDLVRLADAAFAQPRIAELTSTSEILVADQRDGKPVIVKNTNTLVGSDLRVSGGKTGWTESAQGVLVSRIRGIGERELIVIVLESPGREQRFSDVRTLADWAFANQSGTVAP